MNSQRFHREDKPETGFVYLSDLVRSIWSARLFIVSFTVAATLAAIVVAFVLPNVYRAEALVGPGSDSAHLQNSGFSDSFSGLASLAGIRLSSSGAEERLRYAIELLQSRRFLTQFIESRKLKVPLVAAKDWDAENDRLAIDSDIYDQEAEDWVWEEGDDESAEPSLLEAYEEFLDILDVSQSAKTGFVSLSVEHYSPHVAKQWVDWIIEDLNAMVMAEDVSEARHAIEYLTAQAEQTSRAELQQIFYRLIEEQTKIVVLARVSKEYAVKTIDPAFLPEKKYRPKRVMIILFAFLASLLISAAAVVISSLLLVRDDDAN